MYGVHTLWFGVEYPPQDPESEHLLPICGDVWKGLESLGNGTYLEEASHKGQALRCPGWP